MINRLVFFFLLALTLQQNGFAAEVALRDADLPTALLQSRECGAKLFEGHRVLFCIYGTDRSRNPNIIFQFHGLGGNRFIWEHMAALKKVRQIWQHKGYTPPTVITLSMGPYWVLTKVKKRGGLLNLFHDQVLPYFENYVGGLSGQYSGGHRQLLGESMGGYNALQLYLNYPQDFAKVAAASPALPTFSFEADKDEIKAYARRTGANYLLAAFVAKMGHIEFATAEEWAAHNPFELVLKTEELAPELYISGAEKDRYGFFEGAQKFSALAASVGRPVQFVPIHNGHHRSIDSKSLSDFLSSN